MDVLVCVSPLSRLGAPSSRLRRGSFALGTGRSPMRKPHVPCEWNRLAGRPSHGAGPSPPTSASKCNEHAAFSSSSGCGPYLVRMIQGKKARPIQKDGTLQRVLVGGPGPAPTGGHPWVGPPGASTCNEHAAFSSGCGPYLVRMIHGKKARPIQKDGTLQRVLVGGPGPAPTVGRPARRFHMQ